jgi:membrane protease YdiL (CAAX protease family)
VSDERLWTAAAYAALAGVAVVALVGLAIYFAVRKKSWLPLQRLRPGNWAGYEVIVAFCVGNGLPLLIVLILFLIGFFNPILGVAPEMNPPGPAAKAYLFRCINVAGPLTLAATLGVLVGVLFVRSQTRPRPYGLSWARWPANLGLGLAAFLIATPVVLALHALIALAHPQEHPFVELSRQMQDWEWLFLAFQVIVQAPVLEEILFRGILLGWLRRASLSGHLAVSLMTIFVAIYQASAMPSAWDYVGPGVFAVLCAAAYAFFTYRMATRFQLNETEIRQWQLEPVNFTHEGTVPTSEEDLREMRRQHRETDERRRQEWGRQNAWLAIFGSAMLFAVFHTGAWPAPVALLFLALVLGWLAMRTQSLIGPITLHALFNLVSLIVLYGSTLFAPAQNGNAATTALRPSLLGSMTSSVPASQLPLRK